MVTALARGCRRHRHGSSWPGRHGRARPWWPWATSPGDGSTTGSYEILTGALRDTWSVNAGDPGFTSGQDGTLSNETSELSRRIDLVLTRSSCRTRIRTLEAHLVGDTPFQVAVPRWPSDHAGVVATLALR